VKSQEKGGKKREKMHHGNRPEIKAGMEKRSVQYEKRESTDREKGKKPTKKQKGGSDVGVGKKQGDPLAGKPDKKKGPGEDHKVRVTGRQWRGLQKKKKKNRAKKSTQGRSNKKLHVGGRRPSCGVDSPKKPNQEKRLKGGNKKKAEMRGKNDHGAEYSQGNDGEKKKPRR